MKFPLLLFALVFNIVHTAPHEEFALRTLTDHPEASCLDGSPYAFYKFKSRTISNNKKWLIYFEGGAWCFGENSCRGRSLTDLGSSLNYPEALPRNATSGGNYFLSTNCEMSPFCDFNVAILKYCDGASFTGDGTFKELQFKGFQNLQAALTDLKINDNLDEAVEVVLSGGSAGGMSAYLHADFVHENLLSTNPALDKYAVIPVSGFFLDRENVYKKHIFGQAMKDLFHMANSTGGVPKNCRAQFEDPSDCMLPQNSYASIESQIFVIDSTLDSFSIPCIMTTELTEDGALSCGGTKGWENCSALWLYDLDQHCTQDQIYSLTEWQGSFMRYISESGETFKRNGNGAFLHQCYTHVAANFPSWTGFTLPNDMTKLDGKRTSMRDAVMAWYKGNVGETVRTTVEPMIFRDALWGLDGVITNPTCTY